MKTVDDILSPERLQQIHREAESYEKGLAHGLTVREDLPPGLSELWANGTCQRDTVAFGIHHLHRLLLLAECGALTDAERLSAMRDVCTSLREVLSQEFGLCGKENTDVGDEHLHDDAIGSRRTGCGGRCQPGTCRAQGASPGSSQPTDGQNH